MFMTTEEAYNRILFEHFEIEDEETRRALIGIDEADQNQVMLSLTSKLYESIVEKVDEIDYGEIPKSKGDITKIPNYDKMCECLDIMDQLITELKQDNSSVKIIKDAITNLQARKGQFEKGFKLNLELPMLIYNTIALAIVSATSYLIASVIEFIKSPNDETIDISINKVALVRSKDHCLFRNLDKFNKACADGSIDKAIDYTISRNVKNFAGSTSVIVVSAAVIAILISIIPIMRELIFLFYYTRARISNYFDIQADLLEINAAKLESEATNKNDEKKKIARKQQAVAKNFRGIANAVAIKTKEADVKTSKEIINDTKRYKAKEVIDSVPNSSSPVEAETTSTGSLF